jgi:hypothetical protein
MPPVCVEPPNNRPGMVLVEPLQGLFHFRRNGARCGGSLDSMELGEAECAQLALPARQSAPLSPFTATA